MNQLAILICSTYTTPLQMRVGSFKMDNEVMWNFILLFYLIYKSHFKNTYSINEEDMESNPHPTK